MLRIKTNKNFIDERERESEVWYEARERGLFLAIFVFFGVNNE